MRYRNNLKGNLSFKSFVPTLMPDYTIRESPVLAKIDTAEFIPPVDDNMTRALSDLDNFMNYSELNPFVKAAMIHYQFEMIHPFIDANGRVGRILNTLFLYENHLLQHPVLHIRVIVAKL